MLLAVFHLWQDRMAWQSQDLVEDVLDHPNSSLLYEDYLLQDDGVNAPNEYHNQPFHQAQNTGQYRCLLLYLEYVAMN